MQDDFQKLTRTAPERRRYFTPGWFRSLLSGREGLGDTFFIGNYGVTMLLVLAGFGLAALAAATHSAAAVSAVVRLCQIAALIWYLALLPALFRAARRSPQVGGWRWVGVAHLLVQIVAVVFWLNR
ncbi:MAG: hypothetical protein Q4G24_04945 [Paracoccus sp. (in: a-proteobacteria)]|uniref:hypothetical protein n=1 Tax=Paracoccus sp. TaxID=267 RepID=UPI0026E013FB|nr:hypothetical protein [Paracoccus sp. (in: a-proteobacteria)]MDO5620800.1 hypothetical protein [Paracoccus sp. (in: a-proteobacteria)]